MVSCRWRWPSVSSQIVLETRKVNSNLRYTSNQPATRQSANSSVWWNHTESYILLPLLFAGWHSVVAVVRLTPVRGGSMLSCGWMHRLHPCHQFVHEPRKQTPGWWKRAVWQQRMLISFPLVIKATSIMHACWVALLNYSHILNPFQEG